MLKMVLGVSEQMVSQLLPQSSYYGDYRPIHILKDIGLLVDLSYKLIENLDLLLSTSIFVFDCFVDCNFFHKSIE